MKEPTLQIVIRTPREKVIDQLVSSLRVPTETGQVGLRPRSEPTVLAVQAGLILLRSSRGTVYAGTAGGLLHNTREMASLLTPLAVAGSDLESVAEKLERLLSVPSEEMEVRKTLGQLENRIRHELKQSDAPHATTAGKP